MSIIQRLGGFAKPPIGTTRPTQFNTSSIKCQSHKTTYGQVTILPSHSVLVDFRESQRRRGLVGDEILLIDSDGSKVSQFSIVSFGFYSLKLCEVSIYNAPHLSSPSCLIEPVHVFSLDALPPTYWKQYNDTTRLIEQIKQRTPKVSSLSVCHLMEANGSIACCLLDYR